MRLRWIALGSFCFGAVWIATGAAAELVSVLGSPVYIEDFEGEIAFPTTPEVDTLGFGGTLAFRSGNPLPLAPTISDGEALIAVQEASPFTVPLRGSGVEVPISMLADSAIGVSGCFDGYETVKDPTNGQFQTAAVTLSDSTLDNGASGYLLELGSGALRLAVSNLGPGILLGYDDVFLTTSAEDAIRGGMPFVVELLFDGTARTAQASLTVGGETFTTDAMSSSTFDLMDAIDAVLLVNTTTNNAPPIATIASDLKDFAIYAAPEPGGSAAAGVALFTLAMRARRRPRPRRTTP